jgi:hypothetical protein
MIHMNRESRYLDWITDNVPGDGWNQCFTMTLSMKAAFPELIRVRGHVLLSNGWPLRPHWWLRAPDGSIVDPTVAQFSNAYHGTNTTVISYQEWDETQPAPTGSCANCAHGLCYNGDMFCCMYCETAFAKDLSINS